LSMMANEGAIYQNQVGVTFIVDCASFLILSYLPQINTDQLAEISAIRVAR
jgi:hypothetical protein